MLLSVVGYDGPKFPGRIGHAIVVRVVVAAILQLRSWNIGGFHGDSAGVVDPSQEQRGCVFFNVFIGCFPRAAPMTIVVNNQNPSWRKERVELGQFMFGGFVPVTATKCPSTIGALQRRSFRMESAFVGSINSLSNALLATSRPIRIQPLALNAL